MKPEQVRKRASHGFEPFAIATTEGRRFEVAHPEFIAVGKCTVLVLSANDVTTKTHTSQIVSIEDLPTKPRK